MRAHAPHQVMVDAQLHLAADLERRAQEHVERMVDRALARILDGHHAEIGDAALDLVKHLVDRGQRQRAHRGAEMLQHGGLGERALGSQECDLERLLLREARGHDLAEQPRDFLVAQRPRLRSSALRSTSASRSGR